MSCDTGNQPVCTCVYVCVCVCASYQAIIGGEITTGVSSISDSKTLHLVLICTLYHAIPKHHKYLEFVSICNVMLMKYGLRGHSCRNCTLPPSQAGWKGRETTMGSIEGWGGCGVSTVQWTVHPSLQCYCTSGSTLKEQETTSVLQTPTVGSPLTYRAFHTAVQ